MSKKYRVLSINPGSTTTKFAVYDGEELLFDKTLDHTAEDLAPFPTLFDQFDFRKKAIMNELKTQGVELDSLDAVSGRGGDLGPILSGTYTVNDLMVEKSKPGTHASNLGPIIADDFAKELGIKAFTVDPVTVDEFEDVARITGWPEFPRRSGFHALNQKAIARKAAKDLDKPYDQVNLIVAHMGGGISVGAHKKGKTVDVNISDGNLFTPERGVVHASQLLKLAFSGEMSQKDIQKRIFGNGGLYAHLGTKDAREVEKMIEDGDEKAMLVYKAMAYNVAKAIGSVAAVLDGDVDAIALTGGIAYSKLFTGWIAEKVKFIAPVKVYGGEKELESLAYGALRVLKGEEEAREYDYKISNKDK